MDVTDGVRDHALEAALAFLARHEPSNRGPKPTSDNRASILKRAARLRAKLAKEAQQSSTEASRSEQPKKAEPKNPALPRMPRKPEHVKDPAEDAARMAEYAAQREEAMRAKAAHAEQEKQRHRTATIGSRRPLPFFRPSDGAAGTQRRSHVAHTRRPSVPMPGRVAVRLRGRRTSFKASRRASEVLRQPAVGQLRTPLGARTLTTGAVLMCALDRSPEPATEAY